MYLLSQGQKQKKHRLQPLLFPSNIKKFSTFADSRNGLNFPPIHHPKGFFESKDRVVNFEKYAQNFSTLSSLLSKICRVIGSRQADKPKTKFQFHRLAFAILPRQTANTSERNFSLIPCDFRNQNRLHLNPKTKGSARPF